MLPRIPTFSGGSQLKLLLAGKFKTNIGGKSQLQKMGLRVYDLLCSSTHRRIVLVEYK